ncbi:MAG: GNAT family N-acetyltransferase [Isosphaeraceae bacterium]
MSLDARLAPAEEVLPLRDLHRREMNCQIVLDSWLGRGWADSYLLFRNDRVVGYGLVGGVRNAPKDVIIEFHVSPDFRADALPLFRRLATVSHARSIEAQTNDLPLSLCLWDCAREIESDTILFHDAVTTHLVLPEARVRKVRESDREAIRLRDLDPDAGWLVERDGQPLATGGVLFHYNVPYGDVHMAVAEPFRRQGIGSFLVQELKRNCYELGRIPAARCKVANVGSRATLQKAGMLPCARVLTGRLDPVPSDLHVGVDSND